MTVSYPKEKINILLLEHISAEAVAELQQHGYHNIRSLNGAMSETELLAAISDVHILGIRSKTKITATVLAAAPRLLAIGCFCIGTNQVDKEAALQHGVVVFNSPYSNTRSVAELVIGAAIMLIRRIPEKNKAVHDGLWLKAADSSRELRGKKLGIIGYGNIGSQVSILAEALGMHVLFYDPEKKLPLGNAVAAATMDQVLQQADILTLHVPASASTVQLISEAKLSLCKKGALLINYARGEVLDMAALESALQSGHLGGAAIDVYPSEPEKNGDPFTCPLQGFKNVLLTPHIGGSTEEAQANIGLDVSHKLITYIETGDTQGSHTIPTLHLPSQDGTHRILHIHHNIPGILGAINSVFSSLGINISGQYLKTNETIGYVVSDISIPLNSGLMDRLKAIDGTIRARMVY